MGRRSGRLSGVALVACLACAALLPASAVAFQTIAIEPNGLEPGEVLVIRGDQVRTSDEITVRLDLETGELVLTHDILEPLPPECHAVGPGPPFKEVRCPALGIVGVYIYAGTGKDKVVTHLESPTDALIRVLAFPGSESDFFEGGEEEDEVFDEEDGFGDLVVLGGGEDYATMGGGPDVVHGGPGADFAKLGSGDDNGFGGAGKDKFLGGPGRDHLYGGAALDLLNGGPGRDHCFGGAGGAKPISCEIGVHYGRMRDY